MRLRARDCAARRIHMTVARRVAALLPVWTLPLLALLLLAHTADAQSANCAALTTCSSCTAAVNCSWCVSQQRCVDLRSPRVSTLEVNTPPQFDVQCGCLLDSANVGSICTAGVGAQLFLQRELNVGGRDIVGEPLPPVNTWMQVNGVDVNISVVSVFLLDSPPLSEVMLLDRPTVLNATLLQLAPAVIGIGGNYTLGFVEASTCAIASLNLALEQKTSPVLASFLISLFILLIGIAVHVFAPRLYVRYGMTGVRVPGWPSWSDVRELLSLSGSALRAVQGEGAVIFVWFARATLAASLVITFLYAIVTALCYNQGEAPGIASFARLTSAHLAPTQTSLRAFFFACLALFALIIAYLALWAFVTRRALVKRLAAEASSALAVKDFAVLIRGLPRDSVCLPGVYAALYTIFGQHIRAAQPVMMPGKDNEFCGCLFLVLDRPVLAMDVWRALYETSRGRSHSVMLKLGNPLSAVPARGSVSLPVPPPPPPPPTGPPVRPLSTAEVRIDLAADAGPSRAGPASAAPAPPPRRPPSLSRRLSSPGALQPPPAPPQKPPPPPPLPRTVAADADTPSSPVSAPLQLPPPPPPLSSDSAALTPSSSTARLLPPLPPSPPPRTASVAAVASLAAGVNPGEARLGLAILAQCTVQRAPAPDDVLWENLTVHPPRRLQVMALRAAYIVLTFGIGSLLTAVALLLQQMLRTPTVLYIVGRFNAPVVASTLPVLPPLLISVFRMVTDSLAIKVVAYERVPSRHMREETITVLLGLSQFTMLLAGPFLWFFIGERLVFGLITRVSSEYAQRNQDLAVYVFSLVVQQALLVPGLRLMDIFVLLKAARDYLRDRRLGPVYPAYSRYFPYVEQYAIYVNTLLMLELGDAPTCALAAAVILMNYLADRYAILFVAQRSTTMETHQRQLRFVYRALWIFAPLYLVVSLILTGLLANSSLLVLGLTFLGVVGAFVLVCVLLWKRGLLSLESAHMTSTPVDVVVPLPFVEQLSRAYKPPSVFEAEGDAVLG